MHIIAGVDPQIMYWGFILYGEGGVVLIEVGLQRWFYVNLKKSDNS